MHILPMEVTWDPEKARSNLKKHRISFATSEPVFYDPFAITKQDLDSIDEPRFVTIGVDAFERLIVVAYTYREDVIRLISARKANRKERRIYGKALRLQ